MTFTKYSCFAILLLVTLSSCAKLSRFGGTKQPPVSYPSSPAPKAQQLAEWNAETFFIIKNITSELGQSIKEEVSSKILKNPNAIRVLTMEEYEEVGINDKFDFGFAIHPDEVSAVSKLAGIQQVIMDFSEKEVVPLKLVRNMLFYESVYGAAASFTRIYGVASAGARIDVDDGSNIIVTTRTNANGEWVAEIRQNSELSNRNGIVYVKITKGSAIQYLAMNILDKSQQKIMFSDVPRNSVLFH